MPYPTLQYSAGDFESSSIAGWLTSVKDEMLLPPKRVPTLLIRSTDAPASAGISASGGAPEYVSTAQLLATLAAPVGQAINEEEWRAVMQGF